MVGGKWPEMKNAAQSVHSSRLPQELKNNTKRTPCPERVDPGSSQAQEPPTRHWLFSMPQHINHSTHTLLSCVLGSRNSSRITCLRMGAVGIRSLGGEKGQYSWWLLTHGRRRKHRRWAAKTPYPLVHPPARQLWTEDYNVTTTLSHTPFARSCTMEKANIKQASEIKDELSTKIIPKHWEKVNILKEISNPTHRRTFMLWNRSQSKNNYTFSGGNGYLLDFLKINQKIEHDFETLKIPHKNDQNGHS